MGVEGRPIGVEGRSVGLDGWSIGPDGRCRDVDVSEHTNSVAGRGVSGLAIAYDPVVDSHGLGVRFGGIRGKRDEIVDRDDGVADGLGVRSNTRCSVDA